MAADKPADKPAFSMSNPFVEPDPKMEAKPDPKPHPERDLMPEPEPDEPKPASMAMTKAELLEQSQRLESGDVAGMPETTEPRVMSTETRSATIEGETRTWTEASEDQVPEEYRLVWARSRAAGG